MIITPQDRRNNPIQATLYKRLMSIIGHIRHRCNNPHNEEYQNYGGRGVKYCKKWSTGIGFMDDVDKIDGWDLNKFLQNKLQLDKDIKIKGNKLYSKETCMWVSHHKNMSVLPSIQTSFYSFNLYTKAVNKWHSIYEFIEFNPKLNKGVASAVLHHRKHKVGNYILWYSSEQPPKVIYYTAIKGDNKIWDINKQRLSLKISCDRTAVSSSFRGNKFKNGYRIGFSILNLKYIIK